MNITEKIIKAHLVHGDMKKGSEIAIKIDQTLTQDATGTMAYLQFESLALSRVKTELSLSYVDHNTLQQGYENADDHEYLKSIAKRYGILYSKPGNGICHQVHLERFGRPGKTLLGSDSHTPTNGGIGMLAIGAGGLDVALAMVKQPFYFTRPLVIKINLTGKLQPFVSAKDIILKVLELLSTKGNVGYAVEYSGKALKTLSIPERAAITNMGAELGVTTSIFPSDETTKEFLRAQERVKDWIELKADNDAVYDKIITINLSELEPLIAKPHSPGNIDKVKNLKNIKVNQVCIGSCTNSSYRDLMTAANMLKNRKINKNVELIIAPGSRQVAEMISGSALGEFIRAGARIAETACGFCIGAGHAPETNAVSIRTSNRNFLGRSGTKTARIYLTSVETAVACALTGKITDPRFLKIKYQKIALPKKLYIDDSMILKDYDRKTKIFRGPNIGNPPSCDRLKDTLRGIALIKVGDKITTDHIMPAGPRLKFRSNIAEYSEFVFENMDREFSKKAIVNKEKGIDNFIIAGLSYGQGSSREHAALCPSYLNVKAVIAKSIERIHKANLINFGILPLIFATGRDYKTIEKEDKLEIVDIFGSLKKNEDLILKNKTKDIEIKLKYDLSQRDKEILFAGGKLNYVKTLLKQERQ